MTQVHIFQTDFIRLEMLRTNHTNDGNSDLQPDFIWYKARGGAYAHGLYDSTRGVTKVFKSNATSAEDTRTAGRFDLF